jgi:hypothetical protein
MVECATAAWREHVLDGCTRADSARNTTAGPLAPLAAVTRRAACVVGGKSAGPSTRGVLRRAAVRRGGGGIGASQRHAGSVAQCTMR